MNKVISSEKLEYLKKYLKNLDFLDTNLFPDNTEDQILINFKNSFYQLTKNIDLISESSDFFQIIETFKSQFEYSLLDFKKLQNTYTPKKDLMIKEFLKVSDFKINELLNQYDENKSLDSDLLTYLKESTIKSLNIFLFLNTQDSLEESLKCIKKLSQNYIKSINKVENIEELEKIREQFVENSNNILSLVTEHPYFEKVISIISFSSLNKLNSEFLNYEKEFFNIKKSNNFLNVIKNMFSNNSANDYENLSNFASVVLKKYNLKSLDLTKCNSIDNCLKFLTTFDKIMTELFDKININPEKLGLFNTISVSISSETKYSVGSSTVFIGLNDFENKNLILKQFIEALGNYLHINSKEQNNNFSSEKKSIISKVEEFFQKINQEIQPELVINSNSIIRNLSTNILVSKLGFSWFSLSNNQQNLLIEQNNSLISDFIQNPNLQQKYDLSLASLRKELYDSQEFNSKFDKFFKNFKSSIDTSNSIINNDSSSFNSQKILQVRKSLKHNTIKNTGNSP